MTPRVALIALLPSMALAQVFDSFRISVQSRDHVIDFVDVQQPERSYNLQGHQLMSLGLDGRIEHFDLIITDLRPKGIDKLQITNADSNALWVHLPSDRWIKLAQDSVLQVPSGTSVSLPNEHFIRLKLTKFAATTAPVTPETAAPLRFSPNPALRHEPITLLNIKDDRTADLALSSNPLLAIFDIQVELPENQEKIPDALEYFLVLAGVERHDYRFRKLKHYLFELVSILKCDWHCLVMAVGYVYAMMNRGGESDFPVLQAATKGPSIITTAIILSTKANLDLPCFDESRPKFRPNMFEIPRGLGQPYLDPISLKKQELYLLKTLDWSVTVPLEVFEEFEGLIKDAITKPVTDTSPNSVAEVHEGSQWFDDVSLDVTESWAQEMTLNSEQVL